MSIGGHVSLAPLSRYSHVRTVAKRCAHSTRSPRASAQADRETQGGRISAAVLQWPVEEMQTTVFSELVFTGLAVRRFQRPA